MKGFAVVMALQLSVASADVTFVQKLQGADTVIMLTYPAPGTVLRTCLVMRDWDSRQEIERKCWTPKNQGFDRFVWKGFDVEHDYRYLTAEVTVRHAGGRVDIHTAVPVTARDS